MNDPEESVAIEPSLEESDVTEEQVELNDSRDDEIIEPESQQEPQKTQRQEMMDYIIEKREEMEGEETQAFTDSEESTPDETLTVKVDGIEKQIPIDQARAIIQKNMAADKRLHEAAIKKQELENRERQLNEKEQYQRQNPPFKVDPVDPNVKDKLQSAIDAVYDGETDDAVEALAEVFSGRNQATPDVSAISNTVTDNVIKALQQKSFEDEVAKGNQQFQKDFPDIAGDHYLYQVANERTHEMMIEHPDWSPTRIINEAGRITRDWVKQVSGNPSGNGSTATTSRREQKKQLQSLPRSAGSVAHQPQQKDDLPMTPKQIIDNMKLARHQAT
ncbi:MAG: hypothetical protein LPD71_00105 [Shewanella sp.]|nr:hypothetical protein [Shewanella sp.]MCF1437204.1 hypothetical protein [Shewanella sp.]MCF1459482.1 hypothetical protein [Shewanella sp.]